MKLCLVKFNKNRVGQTRRIYHHLGLITKYLRQLFVISIFKYSHASSIDEDVGAAADPLTSGLESGLRVRIEGDLEEV